MNDATYKKSFDLFLKRTDEKSVIKKFIDRHIPLHEDIRFLDIGGGDGSLAIMISKKVGSTLVIEPNRDFCKQLRKKGIRTINTKWEDAYPNGAYDFILAAYVVTYFPKNKRKKLIEKIYKYLRFNGTALILSVDAKRGSWRQIHTYFYKLTGHTHYSSDKELKKIIQKYKLITTTFKTHIIAKNADEMLEILGFDFYKYLEKFSKFSENLKRFMKKYTNKDGKVNLEMVHNAYIINKQ